MGDLDFSALDKLAGGRVARKTPETYKTINGEENAVHAISDGLESIRHYTQLEAASRDSQQFAAICREYQENIKKCGQLRTEIIKGIEAGEDTRSLLLKAIEAISKMTGDALFYELNRKRLDQRAGAGK